MDGNGDDGNDDGAGVIYYYIEYVRYIVIYIYTCASMYFIYIYIIYRVMYSIHYIRKYMMRMQEEIPKNSSFNVKHKHTNNSYRMCLRLVSYTHLVD